MPEAPPVRMVHLGIGNFHRAHQAWYTARAPDSACWGIARFTSRRPDMAEQLGPQDGLYTPITRGATGNDFMLIGALAAVHPRKWGLSGLPSPLKGCGDHDHRH